MAAQVSSADRSILSSTMTVNAMRDAKYRHPANAIAELIDNSIDEFARNVELLIEEGQVRVNAREIWRVHSLAVLDNGEGMDDETLGQALRFGGRGGRQSIRKIGKYGMGLPTASVSQCKRLDVWSWQSSPENACHAYLDIDRVQSGEQQAILTEQQQPPSVWLNRAKLDVSEKGTLVVWSNIDRITQRADTLFRHLEEEIGRTYRHYISNGEVRIRMAAYRDGVLRVEDNVLPNDPLYLMAPSNTPEPWANRPMFRPVPDMDRTYQVQIVDQETQIQKTEVVEVRYSKVNDDPEAIGGNKNARPGSEAHGRHARRNMGVSIIREGREIVLDDNCIDTAMGGGSYPLNRWWGCEVHFNSGLDDLFGVDHNKQMVSNFSQLLRQVALTPAEHGIELGDQLGVEDDPLAGIAVEIRRNIASLMRSISEVFSKRPGVSRKVGSKVDPAGEAEQTATTITEESRRQGEIPNTPTDLVFDGATTDEKVAGATQAFVDAGYSGERAKDEAVLLVNSGNRYRFIDAFLPGHYVFHTEPNSGVLFVKLNMNHRFHRYLKTLEGDPEEGSDATNETAAVGLRLAILALARLDDEFIDQDAKLKFQENLGLWGRMLNRIIDEGAAHGGG